MVFHQRLILSTATPLSHESMPTFHEAAVVRQVMDAIWDGFAIGKGDIMARVRQSCLVPWLAIPSRYSRNSQ